MNDDDNTNNASSAADHDLTASVSPHLDLHMMFPLLEYVDSLIAQGRIPYSVNDVAAARLALLRPTHMVDYAMDIHRELHGADTKVPEEMEERKVRVFERLEELRKGCKGFDELWKEEGRRASLMQNGKWNVAGLAEVGITSDVVETYRQLAKFNYDCGDYETARDMIECYLSLFSSPPQSNNNGEDDETANENKQQEDKTSTEGNPAVYYLRGITTDLLEVLWGRLSCEILLESWEDAHVALTAVKTAVETLSSSSSDGLTALEALRQRTWLLHWSLFVFWNDSAKGLENMVALFTTERYLQAITTNAPHLLRYLVAAVLLVKRRVANSGGSGGGSSGRDGPAEARRLMKDLVKIMQHCEYSDPVVEFVDCLCVRFDFEKAQKKLAECEEVLATDFFLCKQTALFMEEARVFVFENYCRIHHKIDLDALGERLAMDQAHAERWIVDLIRNALLDAKIDSEQKCVVMGGEPQSVYEQVMEKTRDLNLRSGTLTSNLSNLLNDAKKEKAKKARAALDDDEY